MLILSSKFPVASTQAANHETFLPWSQQHRRCSAVQQRTSTTTNALTEGTTGHDTQLNVAYNVMLLSCIWRNFRWIDEVTFAHCIQKFWFCAEGESEGRWLHENGKAAGIMSVAVVEVWDKNFGREAGTLIHQAFLQLHICSVLTHLHRNTKASFMLGFLGQACYYSDIWYLDIYSIFYSLSVCISADYLCNYWLLRFFKDQEELLFFLLHDNWKLKSTGGID